jgi:crossover junction endodeoxyribonuclease RuvC
VIVRIAGIDPGTQLAGHAVLDLDVDTGLPSVVDVGVWDLGKGDRLVRLGRLAETLDRWLDDVAPIVVSLEASAFVGPHARAAIALAEARGIVFAIARIGDVAIAQYSAQTVKKAITGKGNAAKPVVAARIVARFGLDPELGHDATDALAIALTHALQVRRS